MRQMITQGQIVINYKPKDFMVINLFSHCLFDEREGEGREDRYVCVRVKL